MFEYKSLAVYLGSSGHCKQIFTDMAAELGNKIAQEGKRLVYGGMDTGLMGEVANNALAPTIANVKPAHVTGVVPTDLRDKDHAHPGLSDIVVVKTLGERKLEMFKLADAVMAIAGGFGTIDELTEILYWASIGSHNKPAILVNTNGYYDHLIDFLNILPDMPKAHFIVADNIDEAFDKLNNWTAPKTTGKKVYFPDFEEEILSADDNNPLIIKEASLKNLYLVSMALGLKQLGTHHRKIGILNIDGNYDSLMKWIYKAQKERFITKYCTELFSIADTPDELEKKMKKQSANILINLEKEKWNKSFTNTPIK